MALPLYLAMTASEIQENSSLPPNMAYMACHFSPYGTGLSNCPSFLPEGALLILNDRTPICGHVPGLICRELEAIAGSFGCAGILLDFQRKGYREQYDLAQILAVSLPCPVGVTPDYARDLPCPVFLPHVPADTPLKEYLRPWKGREVWLEAALDGLEITLTENGSVSVSLPHPGSGTGFLCEPLHCHYNIHTSPEKAVFNLCRNREDLDSLLEEAMHLGVTRAVGLWQELWDA